MAESQANEDDKSNLLMWIITLAQTNDISKQMIDTFTQQWTKAGMNTYSSDEFRKEVKDLSKFCSLLNPDSLNSVQKFWNIIQDNWDQRFPKGENSHYESQSSSKSSRYWTQIYHEGRRQSLNNQHEPGSRSVKSTKVM